MPSTFPSSIDSFTTKVDGVNDVLAAHVNNLQDSVVAVETNIGTGAKGSLADLTTRLAVSMNADGTLKSSSVPAHASTHGIAGSDPVSLDASQIATGTLATARLGSGGATANKVLRGDQTWGSLPIAALPAHASTHGQAGSDPVSLDASQIATGTIATARLGSGTANSTTFLRGDGSWAVPAGSGETGEVLPIITKTTAYTVTNSDCVVLADATSAAFAVTLPQASTVTGLLVNVKKIDSSAHAVTVTAHAGDNIDNASTFALSVQYQSVEIISDGANWWIK